MWLDYSPKIRHLEQQEATHFDKGVLRHLENCAAFCQNIFLILNKKTHFKSEGGLPGDGVGQEHDDAIDAHPGRQQVPLPLLPHVRNNGG